MTAKEKHEHFQRIAPARRDRILADLQSLGNCSNPATYLYDVRELEPIFSAIEAEVSTTRVRMEAKSPYDHIPFRLSAPDTASASRLVVYIASPLAGDVEGDLCFARNACRYAVAHGYTPLASHLLYPQLLDDDEQAERALGTQMGFQLLSFCRELWACGDTISTCMSAEIAAARALGLPIRYLSRQDILAPEMPLPLIRADACCGAASEVQEHG